MSLSITKFGQYAECNYAQCCTLFTIILSVAFYLLFMLNVIMLNVIMLNVIVLNVFTLSVVMLNVVMLNDFILFMLSVVAPFQAKSNVCG